MASETATLPPPSADGVQPPEAGANPGAPLHPGGRRAAILLGGSLLVLLLPVLASAALGGRPVELALDAQTEEAVIHPAPERLNLPATLLIKGDSIVRLVDVDLALQGGVVLYLKRLHRDTLDIHLESEDGHIGTVFHRDGSVVQRLDERAGLRVLLREGAYPAGPFRFSTRRVEVGSVLRLSSGGRQPQLLSGTVTITDRMLLRYGPARSIRMVPGEQFEVPANRAGEAAALGSVRVGVDGERGMAVGLTIRNSTGQISRTHEDENLNSTLWYRITHDPAIVMWCAVVVSLVFVSLRDVIMEELKELWKSILGISR